MKYEINKDTIALIQIDLSTTKVYEYNKILYINEPIMKIIKNNCLLYGSTYNGRHESTKKLIGISHKSPIIIEESNNIICFPTTSPKLDNCNWIFINHIKEYKKNNKNTLITFNNNMNLLLDISIRSFINQYFNAIRLESVIRNKISNL